MSSKSCPNIAAMRKDPELAIEAIGLGKRYRLYEKPSDRLKEAFLHRPCGHDFWALHDVSFTVRRGEALGVVGHNGAGKSTLLQILAGTLKPTTGEAWLRGRVTSLLELGSGFMPDFTGRENVFVNGTALGLPTRELERRLDEIQGFAEIGDFFDQPVKTYSSGMYVRLAFAVQACLDPDILIVDEALAVGDIFFQQKCHAHMAKLLDNGVAILLVSHDVQAIRRYCSSVILLCNGRVVHQGDIETGLRLYCNKSGTINKQVPFTPEVQPTGVNVKCSDREEKESHCNAQVDFWPKPESNFNLEHASIVGEGLEVVRITQVALCNANGKDTKIFEQNEHAFFYIEALFLQDIEQLALGLTLMTADNLPIYCQNSLTEGVEIPEKSYTGTRIRLQWEVVLPLARGDYTFTLSAAEYPAWTKKKILTLSPEVLLNLAKPLIHIGKIGFFSVCAPSHGVQLPFIGLVGLKTNITCNIIS